MAEYSLRPFGHISKKVSKCVVEERKTSSTGRSKKTLGEVIEPNLSINNLFKNLVVDNVLQFYILQLNFICPIIIAEVLQRSCNDIFEVVDQGTGH